MKKPTAPADLWDQMAEIEKRSLAVRPDNSFTAREYADRRGLSVDAAGGLLARMATLGHLKKIKTPGSSKVYWQPITK